MAFPLHACLGLLFVIVATHFWPVVAWTDPQASHAGGTSLLQLTSHQSLHGSKAGAFIQHETLHVQPSDVVSGGSTYTSWFQRMKDSIGNFIASPFMMALAISVMWLNERRNARMTTLISKGRSDVVSIESESAKVVNRDALVHVKDGQLHGVGTLTDARFTKGGSGENIEFRDCAVKLKSAVQVFQWVETKEERKEKDRFGGGETTKVHYKYHTEWSESQHDSKNFNQRHGHENLFEAGKPGTEETCVGRVEYGGGFVLPKELVNQCNDFVGASDAIACDTVISGKHTFSKGQHKETDQGDPSGLGSGIASLMSLLPGRMQADTTGFTVPACHFYWRNGSPNHNGEGEANVGDYRVAFRYIPDGPATVIALQVESDESKTSGRDTFMSYRVIGRKCCGWTEEMEKAALHKEAEKNDDTLEQQDALCGGGCMLCCCCCHLVNMACTRFGRPQIFRAFHGEKSIDDCFTHLTQSNTLVTWGARFIGWILMGSAIAMFLSPLTTFLDVIPLIGWLGNMAISVISAFATLVLTLVIITLAYLTYHPSLGIPLLVLTVALASVPFIINAKVQQA